MFSVRKTNREVKMAGLCVFELYLSNKRVRFTSCIFIKKKQRGFKKIHAFRSQVACFSKITFLFTCIPFSIILAVWIYMVKERDEFERRQMRSHRKWLFFSIMMHLKEKKIYISIYFVIISCIAFLVKNCKKKT